MAASKVTDQQPIVVTVTEMMNYMRCRWMWDHGSFNRQGLTVISPKPAFALGTLVHKSLASWIETPQEDIQSIALAHGKAELARVKSEYKSKVGVGISQSELGVVYDSIGLAHAMLGNYQTKYGTPLPSHFEFVQPEQMCLVPIPGTPHLLEGKLDGLVRDTHERLFILEHKTYGSRPNLDTLNESFQFLAYLWLVYQLNLGPVGGLLYDGLWKREVPPKGKTMDDLFFRTLLMRAPDEIEEFGGQVATIATEIASGPAIYKNHRWEGCWDCDFRKLCVTQSRGEDYEYMRKAYFTERSREDRMIYEDVKAYEE